MSLQTHLIGSRIPLGLYRQVETCTDSTMTIGDVVRLALEQFMSTVSKKTTVHRTNRGNLDIPKIARLGGSDIDL